MLSKKMGKTPTVSSTKRYFPQTITIGKTLLVGPLFMIFTKEKPQGKDVSSQMHTIRPSSLCCFYTVLVEDKNYS